MVASGGENLVELSGRPAVLRPGVVLARPGAEPDPDTAGAYPLLGKLSFTADMEEGHEVRLVESKPPLESTPGDRSLKAIFAPHPELDNCDKDMVDVYQDIAWCNLMIKRNTALSPKETLLMAAVKSVPLLFCLDTNPEIKFDAELQFDLFKEDRVVTTGKGSKKKKRAETSSSSSSSDEFDTTESDSESSDDERNEVICKAVKENPGIAESILKISTYKEQIRKLERFDLQVSSRSGYRHQDLG